MNDWIPLEHELPPVELLVRLKLRDADGEFESPFLCAMDEDGEFWNVAALPHVRVEPKVVAWRRIKVSKPRPDWRDFARVERGGGGG